MEEVLKRLEGIEKFIMTENTKLKEELSETLKSELGDEIEQKILNHMFVFEQEYGRKLTIAFETLVGENVKEVKQNERLDNLDNLSTLHSAYIYNHEDRIDNLEHVKS